MDREILIEIINNFDLEKFINFFRLKNDNFVFPQKEIIIDEKNFSDGIKLAENEFNNDKLGVYAFKVKNELSNKSGKKDQYELAKKVLKNYNDDAGIFIFYDEKGDFRFSFIYITYLGIKRKWSFYKRYTYFVSKEYTNKTFLKQIGDNKFVSLEQIKNLFSIEPLTKDFYLELQSWYFWALDKIYFPDDYKYSDDKLLDTHKRNSISLIRLITRLIFVWFLKQKKLISEILFDKKYLEKLLKNFNKGNNYYNAILQNLFFATLNQKIDKRGFAEDKGYPYTKKDYGIKNLYRYHDRFLINKEEILKIFNQIPFINGGLFDCLDKENEEGKVMYIDGFSRKENKRAKIPDYLFFQKEEVLVDFSNYGLGKRRVRGLFEILSNYNFTTDENTSYDQEIALDPELLGRVFENLLAEYNEETSSTARKKTGSYYTPREIVDFMVNKSIFIYLKEKCSDISEEILEKIVYSNEDVIDLDKNQINKIILAIDNIKILDPACGSGAFPMGFLLKLVNILQKIDPDNKYWYELQYQKAVQEIEKIFKEQGKDVRSEKLIKLNEDFDNNINYPDYSRKLYLIENCIYGVDIQPIATQISRLRFFLSLIIDQKIDNQKENFGIRPLPNLDLKFVTANTLKRLKIPNQFSLLVDDDVKKLQNKIKELRHLYFNATTRKEKINYQQEDKRLRDELAQVIKLKISNLNVKDYHDLKKNLELENEKLEKLLEQPKEKINAIQSGLLGDENIEIEENLNLIKAQKEKISFIEKKIKKIEIFLKENKELENAQKIASYDPFDQNASSDWFDSFWMMGIEKGFDIVIGNPPYIQLQKDQGKLGKDYEDAGYQTFERTGDIYCLFYERGLELLKDKGFLIYITSNKWMRAKYGEKLRRFFVDYNPIILIDLGPDIFESATVDTCILFIQKSKNEKKLKGVKIDKSKDKDLDIEERLEEQGYIIDNLSSSSWFIGSKEECSLKEKIEKIGKSLKDWDVKIYRGVLTGLNEAFIIDSQKREEILNNCKTEEERKRTEAIIKPILRGRDIKRYYYEWAGLWVIVIPAGWTDKNRVSTAPEKFISEYFPSLMRHLKPFEEKAKKRDDQGDYWWELRHCSYYPEFEKEKVVYGQFQDSSEYSFCEAGTYLSSNEYMIGGNYNRKYFLAILNSKLIEWYLTRITGSLGTGLKIGQKSNFEKLPLPPITASNQSIVAQIEALVDKILAAKKENPQADTSTWEKEIDELVYRLYGLTEKEVQAIEKLG